MSAVACRCDLCPPFVSTAGVIPLVHEDRELDPDAGTVPRRRDAEGIDATLVPSGLEMLRPSGTRRNVSVPLVVLPCGVRRIRPAFGVPAIPLGVPLHRQLVVGVDTEAVGRSTLLEAPTAGRAVEDTRRPVVTELVETAGGGHDRDDTKHRHDGGKQDDKSLTLEQRRSPW